MDVIERMFPEPEPVDPDNVKVDSHPLSMHIDIIQENVNQNLDNFEVYEFVFEYDLGSESVYALENDEEYFFIEEGDTLEQNFRGFSDQLEYAFE